MSVNFKTNKPLPGGLPPKPQLTEQQPLPLTPQAKAPAPQPKTETADARAERMRRFGLSEKKVQVGAQQLPASTMMEVLGARMEPVRLVNQPGRVMWVDMDLARELGFPVPPDNRMTPELEKALLEALSFRTLAPGEEPPKGAKVIEGGADRYQGSGMGGAKGAGRAAFLPWLNANIKGVGRTPLASAPNKTDFTHSHGGAPAREGLLEALWGLEADNLFTNTGTRILAVIDAGKNTEWADGSKEPQGLIIRVGNQHRPAHVVEDWVSYGGMDGKASGGTFSAPLFAEQARASGFLQMKNGAPDYKATMLEAIDRQALLTAEQFRHRILHAAVSTSNMEWDGGLLDNGTTTSLQRTEPGKVLNFLQPFGTEHWQRARELENVYGVVVQSLRGGQSPGASSATQIDFTAEMNARYQQHLAVQMLDATGLKRELAESLAGSEPHLAAELSASLQKLASMSNVAGVNVDKTPQNDAATVDVFHMLAGLPEKFFADPKGDHRAAIHELLLVRRESPELTAEIEKFAGLYAKVMTAAEGKASEFYDDVQAMHRSVSSRAKFENQPIDRLQRGNLHDKLNAAIDGFRKSNDPNASARVGAMVDDILSASVRSVEGLLKQGKVRRLADGGLETQARTVAGIDYSVRCYGEHKRRLHLEFPITGDDSKGYVMPSLRVEGETQPPHLHRDQIEALSYRFTTDGWKTVQEVRAKISQGADGKPVVSFDIPTLSSDAGQLEGLFHCTGRGDFWWRDGSSNFRGYAFAVPDKHEAAALAESVGAAAQKVDWL